MPLHQVTGSNLTSQDQNTKAFYGDRFDVQDISNLSLFLYGHALVIIAKNQHGALIGSHHCFFQDKAELEEIISKDLLLNAENTQGKLYVHNDYFCLVPSVLFDPSAKSTYLNFSADVTTDKYEVFYEGVDSHNIQVVGAVEKEMISLWDNVLPDLEIVHGACAPLSYLSSQKGNFLDQELFVFAEHGHIYVAAYAGNELKLFNRFPVQGDQDFLKYNFAVTHQLAFDRLYCRITIIGDVTGIQVDLETSREYFRNIKIGEIQPNQTYSPGAEQFKETNLLEAFWTF